MATKQAVIANDIRWFAAITMINMTVQNVFAIPWIGETKSNKLWSLNGVIEFCEYKIQIVLTNFDEIIKEIKTGKKTTKERQEELIDVLLHGNPSET